jgi:putative DNA primase/helicase
MRIATELVPADFVKAVSPFKWDDEYYLAMLAGARLNTVGEMGDDKAIPAATFKTVIGGDLLTGRHPAGRPISFKNSAAHIFSTNHLITTKDQSEAFFSRWLLVEFPNSRLRLGLPIDPTLADRIIANEMPGIAYWAMQGAARLLRNGKFSQSAAHDRLMAQWRKTTNSLEEFIDEVCTLGIGLKEKRSDFYQFYTLWCKESGRRPFAKGKVKDLLAYNVGLGISLVELDGYETFKGVQIKPGFKASISHV